VLGVKQIIHDSWLFVANYASFKVRKKHHESVQARIKQRILAKRVALLVDLRNKLRVKAYRMHRELKPHEKFYDHPSYKAWYKETLIRNQWAYEIKQDYEYFKDVLKLNRMNKKELDKLAHEHERIFEKVKTTSGLAKPTKEIKIDWISDKFNDQYLVKFRDKLKDISNESYEKILTKQLDSLAMNIGRLKSKREGLRKLAPNLFLRLEAFLKFKSRQKDVGRDFD
jgi:hypothetical protein